MVGAVVGVKASGKELKVSIGIRVRFYDEYGHSAPIYRNFSVSVCLLQCQAPCF